MFQGRIQKLFGRLAAVGILAGLIGLGQAAIAGDWPKWRGPNEDGISTEKDLRTDWDANPLKKLWTAEVGTGFSSVSVSGGRLYTMGHAGGKDTVHCLDAVSGKSLWKHEYAAALDPNLYEGGPNATPTVDGDRVYTLGKQGQIHCVDAQTGKPVWNANLTEITGNKHPDWGFSSSPYIVDDMVILDGGATVALNKADGKVIWKTDDRIKAGYGTAKAFEHGGKKLLAVLNNQALNVLEAQSGKRLASKAWKTSFDTSSATPIVKGDEIWISTGYGKGAGLFKFTGSALDEIYTTKTIRNHFNNSVLLDGKVYGIDGQTSDAKRTSVVCIDYATGKEIWRAPTSKTEIGCGSLMVADGKLIILGDKGLLVMAEAGGSSYKEVARMQVFEGRPKCWTVPVLANGKLYCRTAQGKLICLEIGGKTMAAR